MIDMRWRAATHTDIGAMWMRVVRDAVPGFGYRVLQYRELTPPRYDAVSGEYVSKTLWKDVEVGDE